MSENAVHIFCDCLDCVKRDMIVVGLKERIRVIKEEKRDFSEQSQFINGFVLGHLENILDGKK